MRRAAALVALGAALAGTAAAGQRTREEPRLLPRANPSAVVAADIALMRESRELGRAEALRRAAAPGAVLDTPAGQVTAASLPQARLPALPARRATRMVWSSCDGTLAVSYARTRMADGRVGSSLTVWQRRGEKDYRWLFETGAIDDPQPAPRAAPPGALSEEDIVVDALDRVEGKVADCPRGASSLADRGTRDGKPVDRAAGAPDEGLVQASRDGTLRWRWDETVGGGRQVTVEYMRDGAFQQVIAFPQPWQKA